MANQDLENNETKIAMLKDDEATKSDISVASSKPKENPSFKTLLLLILPVTTLSYVIFLPNFLYLTPKHWCGAENETVELDGGWNQSLSSNQCVALRHNLTSQVNTTTSCAKMYYEQTHGETVVSQFNLVCDSGWKRPTIQCLFMIGIMIGSFFGGTLSDKFGRRLVVRLGFFLGGIIILILSFATSYIFYLIAITITGILHILVYTTSFVLGQESVPCHRRSFAALTINLSFGLGSLIVPLVAYFVRDWRWLLRVVAISTLVYMPVLWIIKESPMWSSQKNRQPGQTKDEVLLDEYENEIKHQKEPDTVVEEIKPNSRESSGSLLCTNRVLRGRMLMMCFLWNVTFLSFYTLSLNVSNLGGDVYLNCVFGALVDIMSYVAMFLVLHKVGRRNSLAACTFVGGALCLLTPPMRNLLEILGTVCAMTGKFFVTTSMSIVILYTGELFPTLQRNTGMGIASMSARVASALSPFLIFTGETIDLSIPFYVMGGLSIAAALMTLTLPETSKSPLPDTLNQAVALNNNRYRIVRKRTDT